MNNLKFIVASTGRCGSVFIAKWLTSIELPCTHEGIFNYESEDVIFSRITEPKLRTLSKCSQFGFNKKNEINWVNPELAIGDSSYLSTLYLNNPLINSIPVLHIVRNPLDVISSFINDFKYFINKTPTVENVYNENGYENIIWKKLPELYHIENNLERACWYYYRWNQIIEESCKYRKYLRINIENFNKEEVCDFLNGNKTLLNKSFSDTKANTNNFKNKKINLKDIQSGYFKNILIEKSIEYNYMKHKTKMI
jgi:hypothetical protein